MIICKTPFRISFFGGGTDFPVYYNNYKNAGVISTSINKYSYISLRHLPSFFEHKHRITYSIVEHVKKNNQIKHPSVRAILNYFKQKSGLEIHYDGDVPAWSGLGTSSSFTVGLLNCMHTLNLNKIDKKKLSEEAIYIEQKLLKESVGSQDQIAAAYGGFNKISFSKNDTFKVQNINFKNKSKKILEDNLLLMYTGIRRLSHKIESHKIKKIKHHNTSLNQISKIKDEALKYFESEDICLKSLGNLMIESWKEKKSLSNKVSNDLIDEVLSIGLNNGAFGGKILGAGGGGFLMFIAPKSKHINIIKKLKKFMFVDFKFEDEGSQIIFNSRDDR